MYSFFSFIQWVLLSIIWGKKIKNKTFSSACSKKLCWNSPGLSVDTAVTQRTIFWPSHQSSFSLCCVASPDWHFWRAGGASTIVRQTLSDNSALVGTSDWPEATEGSEGNDTEMFTSRLHSISYCFFFFLFYWGGLRATRYNACDHLSLTLSISVCVCVCMCVGGCERDRGRERQRERTHRHSPTVPMSYTSSSPSKIFLTFLK